MDVALLTGSSDRLPFHHCGLIADMLKDGIFLGLVLRASSLYLRRECGERGISTSSVRCCWS